MKSALFRKPALVGLDIQPGKLRLVQLAKLRSQYRIERIATHPIPDRLFRDGIIHDWDGLQTELAALVFALKLKSAATAVSLPSKLVRTDHLQVPSGLSRKELETAIWETIKSDSPEAKETLSMDFVELPTTEMGYSSVFFAVAQQAYLQNLIACITKAGLYTKIIDIDRYASLRAACFALPSQRQAAVSSLLHVCDELASLIIFNRDEILFYQQWQEDGSTFNERVREYLAFYNGMHATAAVSQLIFCGSQFDYTSLGEISVNGLPMQVERLVLANRVQIATHLNDENFQTVDYAYLLACGLALRELPPW